MANPNVHEEPCQEKSVIYNIELLVSRVVGHLQGHQQGTGAAALDRKDFI